MSQSMAMAMTSPRSLNIFGRPLSIFGVPVERDTIFSNHKGIYKNHIEKRQRKLIIKTTFIKFFLHQDERILCLTTGYSPVCFKEKIITGPAFLFFKRAIFVFTDKRILHVPTSFNDGARHAISQIRYDDCSTLDIRGRSLTVLYKNGTRESFPFIGRREKKKIASILDGITPTAKEADGLNRRIYLCPSCTNPLKDKVECCPACKLEFKSGRQTKMRALFIPGGGYFYTHYALLGFTLGIGEIAVYTYFLFNLMAFKEGLAVNFGMLTLMLGILICEKCIATFHSGQLTREFIPESKDFTMRKI
jgi:hypothetical protein